MDHNKLEKEILFKEAMAKLFFKKNKYGFFRKVDDAVQDIAFGHSHHGEKFVTYYAGTMGWGYPKLEKIGEDMNEIVSSVGCNFGYLMPDYKFLEWRLAKDDSDEYFSNLITTIINTIKTYILPVMDRYTKISSFVEGHRFGEFPKGLWYDEKLLLLAYLYVGEKKWVYDYIEEKLIRYERQARNAKSDTFMEELVDEKEVFYLNNRYQELLHLYDKLKERYGV